MVRSEPWRRALEQYRWIDRYLSGAEYVRFADAEEARVQEILREFGTGREERSFADAGPYPLFVLAGLLIFGIAATFRMAGATRLSAVASAKADASPANWQPVAMLAIGIVMHLMLAERAGFIVAAAALFWFTARAFDTRHPLRDALFAVAVSVSAWVLFARVLQLALP
jgi:putative tricarboxylic transport membrane protein